MNRQKEGKDPPCKVVILGAPGVGKTALTVRLLTRRFIGEYCPTLENTYRHCMTVDDERVKIEILDTAGEISSCVKESYALWADCFVLVYSVTDQNSFYLIPRIKCFLEETRQATDIVMVTVANKCDLSHVRQVSRDEGEGLAEEMGCGFFEVSASDGTKVHKISELFCELYKEYKGKRGLSREVGSSYKFKEAIQRVINRKPVVKSKDKTKKLSS